MQGAGKIKITVAVTPKVGRSASVSEFCRLPDNPTTDAARAEIEACAARLIAKVIGKAYPKQKGGGG